VRQVKSSWGMMAACGLLCALVPSCDRRTDQVSDAVMIQRANTALSLRKLPKLPDGVTNVRCWTGGTSAIYMNVKFTASPDQALDYLRRVDAGCYLEFQVEAKNYRIIANHSLTSTSQRIKTVNLSLLAKGAGVLSQPWFRSVYEIRHGWYYDYFSQDGPTGYDLYYDLDSRQFYVYWSHG
jgi:hypothetical protein